jgi:hypothetical protein
MTRCAVCGFLGAGSFKFCPDCGAEAGTAGREQRKVVTVLFCDVVGSTALGESVAGARAPSLRLRLYALDADIGLGAGAAKAELEQAIEGHVLTTAELVGTYER